MRDDPQCRRHRRLLHRAQGPAPRHPDGRRGSLKLQLLSPLAPAAGLANGPWRFSLPGADPSDPLQAYPLLSESNHPQGFATMPAASLGQPEAAAACVHASLGGGRRKLVLAESCTGGLVGASLTAFPGSSRYLYGGWIVYANHAKYDWLEVSPWELEEEGAVSDTVVASLLRGCFAHSPVHLALAVSGVAGPDGGSAAKPVGTVWVGVAERSGAAVLRRFLFGGDRQAIRQAAASAGLLMLLELEKLANLGIDTGYKL